MVERQEMEASLDDMWKELYQFKHDNQNWIYARSRTRLVGFRTPSGLHRSRSRASQAQSENSSCLQRQRQKGTEVAPTEALEVSQVEAGEVEATEGTLETLSPKP